METNLLRLVEGEIRDFESNQIQIVPGFYFNQKDTLEQIYLYHNSQFKTGMIDADGDRKYFYNISRNPCKVFTKAIDFDTKNINVLTASGQDSTKTWFFERDLKYWMKDKQFGKVLNRIFDELPVFGSVVLKIIDNVPMFVDLRNFFLAPNADTLNDSNFITEIHRYTVPQFREVAQRMGFKDIEKTIKEFRETRKSKYINIYERYGDIENNDGSISYKRIYIADVGEDTYDHNTNKVINSAGVVLKEDEMEGHPYWEFHLDKIPGRWLGVGVVESLFEPQIKQNETANLESKAAYHLALLLFQTRDPAINRNLLKDSRNGDVLNADSEITQIGMTYPNLAFFNEQTQKWLTNRDELTFSYDVVQGERLPAGTPLGSARLAASMTLSHFDQIRESIALTVKELLFKVIIPNFRKEMTKEHMLRLTGEDLNTLRQMLINTKSTLSLIKYALKNGKLPTQEDYDVMKLGIEEAVKQGKEGLIPIPKDFYKDLKYDIDIDITGESVDTRVRFATRQAILQAITTDPTMTTDPTKRKILFGMAEDGGINPNELFEPQKKQMADMMQQMGNFKGAGGGVSRPVMPQTALPGAETQTL